jgi:hypothetical protein
MKDSKAKISITKTRLCSQGQVLPGRCVEEQTTQNILANRNCTFKKFNQQKSNAQGGINTHIHGRICRTCLILKYAIIDLSPYE